MYKRLSVSEIISTIEMLNQRIDERFPDSGLGKVCRELLETARSSEARCREISKPNVPLRIAMGTLVLLIAGLVTTLFTYVRVSEAALEISQLLQSFDAFLESIVYLGATCIFLVTVESRIKRRRALQAIDEMRSFAHVVDMHQLTKDPQGLIRPGPTTPSSPVRTMTAFELCRYFDYSSEMLSLISKVAALYIQDFRDSEAMDAVDQIEDLTTGLSQKIWQKSALLQTNLKIADTVE